MMDDYNIRCTSCYTLFDTNAAFALHECINYASFRLKDQPILSHLNEGSENAFAKNICYSGETDTGVFRVVEELKTNHVGSNTNNSLHYQEISENVQKDFLQLNENLDNDIKLYSCRFCLKNCTGSDLFEDHFKKFHSNYMPYYCSICGQEFLQENFFNLHMQSHHVGKAYSYNNESSSVTYTHSDIKGTTYASDLCDKKFNSKNVLKHSRNHNEEHFNNTYAKRSSNYGEGILTDQQEKVQSENTNFNGEDTTNKIEKRSLESNKESSFTSMEISCYDDIALLSDCDITLLAFLQSQKLIPDFKLCEKCGNVCEIVKKSNNFFFRCQRQTKSQKCTYIVSILRNTWFSHTNLKMNKCFEIIWCFVNNLSVTRSAKLVNISNKTAVDYYKFCREMCIDYCLRESQVLGGEGKIVEINESKYDKKKFKEKKVEDQWVLGGLERDSEAFFFVPMELQNRENLICIIKDFVLPGTTVISDSVSVYEILGEEGYLYLKVNHRINFMDPEMSKLNAIKRQISACGKRKDDFTGYLATYCWQKLHKKEPFMSFLKEIAKF